MRSLEGREASAQTISRWVVEAIKVYYRLSGISYLLSIKSHSTRAQGSSAGFHYKVLFSTICKSAIWSLEDTFVHHYTIDLHAEKESEVVKAVLQSLFNVGLQRKTDDENRVVLTRNCCLLTFSL